MSVQETVNGHRSTHAFRDLKALRMRVRPRTSQAKLAREADVSPDTLRKCERGEPITESIAIAIFEALNKLQGGVLLFDKVVQVVRQVS